MIHLLRIDEIFEHDKAAFHERREREVIRRPRLIEDLEASVG